MLEAEVGRRDQRGWDGSLTQSTPVSSTSPSPHCHSSGLDVVEEKMGLLFSWESRDTSPILWRDCLEMVTSHSLCKYWEQTGKWNRWQSPWPHVSAQAQPLSPSGNTPLTLHSTLTSSSSAPGCLCGETAWTWPQRELNPQTSFLWGLGALMHHSCYHSQGYPRRHPRGCPGFLTYVWTSVYNSKLSSLWGSG